eukprot:jgi/Galph1/5253/GphlegSOOS_G3804.1
METLETFAEEELTKLGFEGDPSTLAKYVAALLAGTTAPVEDQKDKYVQDLEEFLGSDAQSFVGRILEKYNELFSQRQERKATEKVSQDMKEKGSNHTKESSNSTFRGKLEQRLGGRGGRLRGATNNFSQRERNLAVNSASRVPEHDLSRSIHVRNIPPEKLKVEEIQSYFTRFGTVSDVLLLPQAAPKRAIVTFSSQEEAREAVSCVDAVFSNRFVKVFFARAEDFEDVPMDGKERYRRTETVRGSRPLRNFDQRYQPPNYDFSSIPYGRGGSLHWNASIGSSGNHIQNATCGKRERENNGMHLGETIPEKRSKIEEQESILKKYLENKRYILQRFESLKSTLNYEQKKSILDELKSLDQNIEAIIARKSKLVSENRTVENASSSSEIPKETASS